MSSVRKFHIEDADHLIRVLSPFNVQKSIAIENIKKYGLDEEMDYILEGLDFKPTQKVTISERVQQLAELFQFIFDTKKDCYVRIRNKATGAYYTYNVEALKNPHKLQNILEKSELFRQNLDIMYSLNTYNNMYKAEDSSIFSIHLLAIDVDFDKNEMTLEQCLKMLDYEFDNTIPKPNFIEFGHRIRLLYKVECVGATKKSKNLAKKITDKIAEKLEKYGASGQALTTYGRILGSVNSKDKSVIQIKMLDSQPYMLRDLQKEVLDPPKWLLDAKANNQKVIKLRNDLTLNTARLNDLKRIQKIRDVGYRELLCFLYRNHAVLADRTDPKSEMLAFNDNFDVPQKANKIEQDTRNVEKRQYYLKNEWILSRLDITPEEESTLGLEVILSEAEKKRRNNEHNKKKYRKKNPISKQQKIQELRQKIRSLKDKGFKNNDIAQELNLPSKTLERHITQMRKEGLL
ncbi:hypothetical protein [Priestia flexa]|uniref:hypothetical protein n=1 Tax=Priestia flexa TaxID=86664 RepID=UPI003FD4D362